MLNLVGFNGLPDFIIANNHMRKFFRIINIVQHVIDLAKYLFSKPEKKDNG